MLRVTLIALMLVGVSSFLARFSIPKVDARNNRLFVNPPTVTPESGVEPISVGSKLPFDVRVHVLKDSETGGIVEREEVTLMDFFVGRKVVLVCVPGAFTPNSSEKHLPGYFELRDTFSSKGVSLVCVSVNDPFVMHAWAQSLTAKLDCEVDGNTGCGVTFLADGAGDCARALGLDMQTGPWGGVRFRRASLFVDDGVVKEVNAEEKGAFTELSGAAFILSQIS